MGKPQSTGNLVNALAQDSSNNIGIGGAANASFKLQVTGATNVTGILTLGSTISNGTYTYTLPAATGTLALTSSLSGFVSGSGTTNYLPKFTGASALGNSLIFDNGTNVGIGTTSPSEKLEVVGGGFAAGNGTIKTGITYSSLGLIGTFTNHDFGLISNGTERMRITTGGNVRIGTGTPTQKLDVDGLINSTNGISVGGSGVSVVWTGTQAAYDAIATKSSTTIYFIQ